ncbi:MAG: VWA domain-containing protein [Deltaproteobacteria bacterium]|nr:VWA domain-containing protein [Deltaproteobacteria bacterium]MBW1816023.1 VWA domain-containing protein [Deltaproteobacteria bacterium]MBW2282980.1 VWA domain-containing protein [Deltaproteobacteria bacterium]
MTFRFAYPVILILLAVPAGFLTFVFMRKPAAVTHSMASALAAMAGRKNRVLGLVPVMVRGLCLMLLVLAAARPQLYNVSRDVRSSGVDIMLSLDTSGSMQALDFKLDDRPVSRLTAIKKVVSDFIKKREADRIGFVVFGDEAFTQSPLTMDKGLLLGLVEKMEIGMAGDQTAIGSAIAIGAKRLKDLDAQSRILILLTDGRHNAGDITPVEAAKAAGALGIKIYTIGVGGRGPAPFKVQTPFGTRTIHQRVDLDEDTLKTVAKAGNGRYFRAADSDELSEIYDLIDREEKTEVKVKSFFHYRELYLFFLVPALLLLCIEIFLRTTILRTIP